MSFRSSCRLALSVGSSSTGSKCPNVIETCPFVLGLNNLKPVRRDGARYSFAISIVIMLIFMLGLLFATAILALKTASNVKEMLVPVPVRAR